LPGAGRVLDRDGRGEPDPSGLRLLTGAAECDALSQGAGVGRALAGLLGQQVQDDLVEEPRKLGAVGAQGLGSRVAVSYEHRPGIVHVERWYARGDLVQHAAQGVEIAAVVHLPAADLLGRHVVRGAHGDAGAGEAGGEADVVAEPRYAEVAELHGPVVEPHDVRGLEVTVHDALLMGVAEGVRDLLRDVDDVGHRQRVLLVVLQQLAQVAAFQELHDEVQDTVRLPEVVDDGDSAVLERCGHPRLAAEAFTQNASEGLVLLRPHRFQALDGHLAAQRFVARTPHLAHASAPDQIEQPVAALNQPGVRHRLLSPPSLRCPLLLLRPPRPVQYGCLPAEFVRGGSAPGTEPCHRLHMCPGGRRRRRPPGMRRAALPEVPSWLGRAASPDAGQRLTARRTTNFGSPATVTQLPKIRRSWV